jgi:hypothetical protein
MATLLWPLSLPAAPLVKGYAEVPPNIVLRSTVDAGPPKVRRRFTAGVGQIECGYALTRAEMTTLDDFFFITTGGGALPFLWVEPRRSAELSVRFKEPPHYRPEDSNEVWMASLVLEVLPPGLAERLVLARKVPPPVGSPNPPADPVPEPVAAPYEGPPR